MVLVVPVVSVVYVVPVVSAAPVCVVPVCAALRKAMTQTFVILYSLWSPSMVNSECSTAGFRCACH